MQINVCDTANMEDTAVEYNTFAWLLLYVVQ